MTDNLKGETASPAVAPFDFAEVASDIASERENVGLDHYAALIEAALRKAYEAGSKATEAPLCAASPTVARYRIEPVIDRESSRVGALAVHTTSIGLDENAENKVWILAEDHNRALQAKDAEIAHLRADLKFVGQRLIESANQVDAADAARLHAEQERDEAQEMARRAGSHNYLWEKRYKELEAKLADALRASECEICSRIEGIKGSRAAICHEHYKQAIQGEAAAEAEPESVTD